MKYLLILIATCSLAAFTTTCKLDETVTRDPPVASFTVQNNGCIAPCNVAFTNSSDNASSYSWDFGDGSAKDNAENPTHLFQNPGTYKVVLTAIAEDPNITISDTTSRTVSILPPTLNQTVASFTVDKTTCETPCTVTITNTSINTNSYSWDFGDGNVGNQTASSFTHTYTSEGMFDINLTATGPGGTDEANPLTINVTAPVPPTASFEVDSINHNGYAPATVIFKNTSTNADSYSWDFFDRSSGANNMSTEENPTHEFKGSGTYDVKLIAKNSLNGLEDEFVLSVKVKHTTTFIKEKDKDIRIGEYSIINTQEGYAIAGTISNGSNDDGWLLTLDSTGNTILDKTFDTGKNDLFNSITHTPNGGYAITGATDINASTDYDFEVWLLTTNPGGNIEIDKKFDKGNNKYERGTAISQASNGGYAITGFADIGGQTTAFDLLFLTTNADGSLLKKKGFDKGRIDYGNSVIETFDGKYAMTGMVGTGSGEFLWLLVTDVNGNIHLDTTINTGNNNSGGNSIIQTNSGGFAFTGKSDGDLLFLNTEMNGSIIHNKKFNEGYGADGRSIIRMANGDFAMVGSVLNGTDTDIWLLTIDVNGNKLVDKKFDNGGTEIGTSIIQTLDGGFMIVGTTSFPASFPTDTDLILIKTDANGNVN